MIKIRTSTIVTNVGFWTQTSFLMVTNCIPRTVGVEFTCDDFVAFGSRVRIRHGTFGTLTSEGTRGVFTNSPDSARVRLRTFVYILTLV